MDGRGTPRAPALAQSTSTRNWGTSSIPLGRTLARRGSAAAMPRSWLRAAMRALWPSPPRSSNWKSTPRALPISLTAGGAKAKTKPPRIREKAPMARPAMALTRRSGRFRRRQSFSLTKTMPLFWARPEKPMPAMVMQDSTASFSFS
ncbi:MAG: hypothetical protein BWY88_00759 [Synergistetes bacterium ADurb.Bin520]|nr:MAG: hypothetical protein BWY88_00759 [Synergistetes bacterium ADurb.Bin520]